MRRIHIGKNPYLCLQNSPEPPYDDVIPSLHLIAYLVHCAIPFRPSLSLRCCRIASTPSTGAYALPRKRGTRYIYGPFNSLGNKELGQCQWEWD